ncbi:dihydrofolate reductase [Tieghemiomyces parasiticus]|uniref:Dihydrofolate reductase n=1 Tax=Tieghemiomyces parasiticus TaxID=78921 RepID=A0A9W8DQ81_9FUNG|nr:dihydrofolate reductase [Tieghemiomyces parasiticus]
MRYFRDLTMRPPPASDGAHLPVRNAVIMGRKTWESIPPRFRPLPDRLNVVLSRSTTLPSDITAGNPLVRVAPSLTAALDYLATLPTPTGPTTSSPDRPLALGHVYVIGGGQVYAETLLHPACRKVFLTWVDELADKTAEQPPYDTFFGPMPDHFEIQSHRRLEEVVGASVPQGVQRDEKGSPVEYKFLLFESNLPKCGPAGH